MVLPDASFCSRLGGGAHLALPDKSSDILGYHIII